ncbi:MAG TPA: alpha-isopropylmalate synthase regulatory domain-containing protein [Blastocatellia bacterium]|jgi:hypothetical protein|nr:alpha-isopropylmalate synthase regulatory domain-containing protein [Blastocatellia bacterium]
MTNTPQKRLRFDRAETTRQGDEQCLAEVTLSFADRILKASATESCEGVGPLKAAARAALEATEQAVEGRFRCKLADLDHVNALGKNLIAVLVDIEFEGKQVQVFGSCQLSGNEIDAAVKAALNATNRFFDLAQK